MHMTNAVPLATRSATVARPMYTVPEILDLARAHSGIPSDYALAKRLGVARQTISQMRSGALGLSEEHAEHLAELAGLDPLAVYANAQATRAKRTSQRAFWARVARGLAASVILLLSTAWSATDARAAGFSGGIWSCAGYTFCAIARWWRRRRRGRRIARGVAFPTHLWLGGRLARWLVR